MFCGVCRIAISDIISGNLDLPRWNETREQFGIEHRCLYHSYLIYVASEVGKMQDVVPCFICQIVRNGHVIHVGASQVTCTLNVRTGYLDRTEPWQIQVFARDDTDRFMSFDLEFFAFEQTPALPAFALELDCLDVDVHPHFLSQIGTPDFQRSDSRNAKDLAVFWSKTCKGNHAKCKSRAAVYALPTRVVDLHAGIGSADPQPRLVPGDGIHAHYVALSHRWSPSSNKFGTTSHNIQQRLEAIDFDEMPPVFRDSAIVCLEHGIRYLWIDCLCIIQDSNADWEKECQNMCNVFENSHFTISALQAGSDGAGLFHGRSQHPRTFLRTKDNKVLGLRQNNPWRDALQEDLGVSSMDKRGWILQEKVLSPAILHYGQKQMHWECRTGTLSECWAERSSSRMGMMKHILEAAGRPKSYSHNNSHFTIWYNVIAIYSGMFLTFENDRLAAISGLAERFSVMFGATHAVGLWLEDLHRGLLWRKGWLRNEPENAARPRFVAPSWTWIGNISQHDTITFEWEHGIEHVYPADRLPSDTDAVLLDAKVRPCSNIHRGALRGFLQMWGLVVKVQVTNTPSSRYQTSTFSRAKHIRRFRLSQSLPMPEYLLVTDNKQWFPRPMQCHLDSPTSDTQDVFCLVIADWRYTALPEKPDFKDSDSGSDSDGQGLGDQRCFLMLTRIRKPRKHHHPQDMGVFKRIGMGIASITDGEDFFGGMKEKKFLTIV